LRRGIDRAFSYLPRGVNSRAVLPFLVRDPKLDPLRQDSRFKDILRQMNLAEQEA
jgi:hypothetical protein